jgi:glycerol-3-phosphate O-acyltransferase
VVSRPIEVDEEPPSLPTTPVARDPFTCMTPRFGLLAGAFARRFFRDFAFDEHDLEQLRKLEERGAVVYVMRYSSRLDYFLFNWLFLGAGVRLSGFANGIRYTLHRPFHVATSITFKRWWWRVRYRKNGMRQRDLELTRELLAQGGSLFVFLRTSQLRTQILRRKRAVAAAHKQLDYLKEAVAFAFDEASEVSLVPLALFWRKGTRARKRFLNVFYGAPERPSSTSKVLSFIWNYENLALRVGTPIDLRAFVDQHRDDGPERILKQVRRSLLIFLRREEKPVIGAALRPADQIEDAILADPEVRKQIEAQVSEKGVSLVRAEARALRCLREIAARPSASMLAVLDVLVTWIFRKVFARIEVDGLDRIIDEAKLRPLVLVPSHRSHFDYLILSWLFYERHLVPPQVAAGINLSFWPLGPIFRRGGGFFLRRSFDGDRLYAAVFRSYVQLLLKDGLPQEFFIEGTRSRTGKTLEPRLGMVKMVLEAFRRGVRKDVAMVPIGFTYERLVEEGSMTEERRGKQKKSETLLQLLQARTVLRNRFGSVTVRFGEPISLAHVDSGPRELGEEICRRLNDLVTVGRSSVSAAALLGSPARAVRVADFAERVRQVAAALQAVGLARSGNLQFRLDSDRPEDAIDLLLQAGVVERLERSGGDLITFSDSARERLAYYRTTVTPGLVWFSVLALELEGDVARSELLAGASRWLELLRVEFFPPEAAEREQRLVTALDHALERGWVVQGADDRVAPTAEGRFWLGFFAEQIRPLLETYRALFAAAAQIDGPTPRQKLIEAAQRALEDQLLLGEVRCTESVCPTTLGNALKLLLDEGVLVVEGNERAAQAPYAPGPEQARLGELSARLAHSLRTR